LRNLGSAGYRVDGPGRASTLGYRIAAVGDVNGDGIPDLLATGAYYSAYLGGRTQSWVVYGQRTPGVVDLAQPGRGYEISLPGYHFLTAAGIGDVNGDGIPDLAIGDPMAEPMTVRRTFRIGKRRFVRKETVYNGRVFVVYGQRNADPVDLAHLGRGGYVIDGPRGGQLSSTLAPAGDLNGDGRPDLLVGAPGAGDPAGPASSPPYAPTVYGIFGSPPGSRVNLADPRTPALRLIGDAADGTGPAVGLGALPATAGSTVAVGSPYASAPCRQGSGVVSIVHGISGPATLRLTDLGSSGYRIAGALPADGAGTELAAVPATTTQAPGLLIGAPAFAYSYGLRPGEQPPTWTAALLPITGAPSATRPLRATTCLRAHVLTHSLRSAIAYGLRVRVQIAEVTPRSTVQITLTGHRPSPNPILGAAYLLPRQRTLIARVALNPSDRRRLAHSPSVRVHVFIQLYTQGRETCCATAPASSQTITLRR